MIFEKILGIAACDPRGVIGKEGKLPWDYPEDLKHFSDITLGSPMIMGRLTFLSLPSQYFDGRIIIVFSYTGFGQELGIWPSPVYKPLEFSSYPNLISVSSLTEFFAIKRSFKELYVVGGAQIYSLFLKENLIEEFILTRIKNSYDGDTFFPLSLLDGWPSIKVRETNAFSIYRYFNHRR